MNNFQGNAVKSLASSVARHATSASFVVFLALFSVAVYAQAEEREDSRRNTFRFGSFDMEGVSNWFRSRFSEAELEKYQPEDFAIEQQMCGCYDRPVPHYPYIMILFSTPKGDLIGRPERRGFDTVIIPLAVRHGERYCELESEDQCYGSFSNPCDFSDFRYGSQLAPYFPDCLEVDADSDLEPVRYKIKSAR